MHSRGLNTNSFPSLSQTECVFSRLFIEEKTDATYTVHMLCLSLYEVLPQRRNDDVITSMTHFSDVSLVIKCIMEMGIAHS